MTNFQDLSAVELRKVASKEYGIKGASSGRKADLIAQIEAIETERAEALKAAQAEEAKTVKAKKCRVCTVRPIGGGTGNESKGHAKSLNLCIPCLEFGGWENTHNDGGHGNPYATPSDRDVLDMKSCWVCHPELNRSSATYVGRNGTSRAGMKMTVTQRAPGQIKAGQVAAQVPSASATGTASKNGGYEMFLGINGAVAKLCWDHRGGWDYANCEITFNGKTIRPRNAAAAIRFLNSL